MPYNERSRTYLDSSVFIMALDEPSGFLRTFSNTTLYVSQAALADVVAHAQSDVSGWPLQNLTNILRDTVPKSPLPNLVDTIKISEKLRTVDKLTTKDAYMVAQVMADNQAGMLFTIKEKHDGVYQGFRLCNEKSISLKIFDGTKLRDN